MSGPLDTGTWRWKSSSATWSFERVVSSGESLAGEMERVGRAMLAALPGFAIAAAAHWTTDAAGDEAVLHARGTQIDDALLASTFGEHADVRGVELELDLVVTAPDGVTEVVLERAAQLYLEGEPDKIVVWLDLHVDLYARRSWGVERDNQQLAEINAPRLAGFLARLAESTGAQLESIDAESYAGQATIRGFE